MRIAVTGAGGFIGRATVAAIAARGETPIPVRPAELLSAPAWADAFATTDAVIHLVGKAHGDDGAAAQERVTHRGAVAAAQGAAQAGVSRFVFVSSVAVFGRHASREVLGPDTPVAPASNYGRAKAAAEVEIKAIGDQAGMTVQIVRPAAVYGPGAPGRLAALGRAAIRRLPLPFAAVRNRRTMIDVNALVDALVRLTAYAGPAGVFVAADTGAVSVPDMITALARGAGVQPRLFACPPPLLSTALHVLGQGEKANQLLGDLVFDSRALAAACGWRPVTDPVPGLQAMGRALAGVT